MTESIRQPSDSSFDTDLERPSMGDPEFAEGKVRQMLDEARGLMFEGKVGDKTYANPQHGVEPLIEKWAKELGPANADYIQTMSVAALDAFLKSRGFGTDDTEPGDPVRALLAETVGRFARAATRYHGGEAISLKDIERTLGLRVYHTLSNDYDAVITSVNSGKPLILDGTSKYARDLKALGSQVSGLRTAPRRGQRL